MFCSPGVNVLNLCCYSCEEEIYSHVCILTGVPIFCSGIGLGVCM